MSRVSAISNVPKALPHNDGYYSDSNGPSRVNKIVGRAVSTWARGQVYAVCASLTALRARSPRASGDKLCPRVTCRTLRALAQATRARLDFVGNRSKLPLQPW